jgi:histidinol phosphatase-like PHP family hydrolase
MSDGCLSISELVYRAKIVGYNAIAITDHTDYSNYKHVIDAVRNVQNILTNEYDIKVFSGVELTYVPPKNIKDLTGKCRDYGAQIVVVHGETQAEIVPVGTNLKAIEAGVDILAHPGFISEDEVRLAKEKNVCLEITSRKGHSVTNDWIVDLARKVGDVKLVFNNDVHTPENILYKNQILEILQNLDLSAQDFAIMQNNAGDIFERR